MAIPTPSPGPEDLIDQLHVRIEANLTDPGYVLSSGEYVRDNSMAARSLRREGRQITGVHIGYLGMSETAGEDDDEFFNVIQHRIKIRVYRQYEDSDLAEILTSMKWVRRCMWEIAAILRADTSFGFGDDVEMMPIEMPEDIGEDSNEQLGTFHVCPIDVFVKQKVYAGSGCGS